MAEYDAGALEALRLARALIARPETWCRAAWQRPGDGVVRRCADGALRAVLGMEMPRWPSDVLRTQLDTRPPVYAAAAHALLDAAGWNGPRRHLCWAVAAVNDDVTVEDRRAAHARMLAIVDRAIAALEARAATEAVPA